MKEFKKYIIGFMIGLFFIISITSAFNSGSIGSLFTQISGEWFLKGNNIENSTISKDKLTEALTIEITTNTAKTGITSAQSIAIATNTAKNTKTDSEINTLIKANIGKLPYISNSSNCGGSTVGDIVIKSGILKKCSYSNKVSRVTGFEASWHKQYACEKLCQTKPSGTLNGWHADYTSCAFSDNPKCNGQVVYCYKTYCSYKQYEWVNYN